MFRYFFNHVAKTTEERIFLLAGVSIAATFLFVFVFGLVLLIIATANAFSLFDISKAGPLGDSFNGITGPIIALTLALVTFLAFWAQYRANEQQKDYLKKQRFEDTFFRLLDNHQKIVDAMDLVRVSKSIKQPRLQSTRAQSITEYTTIATKRDCFKTIYSVLPALIDKSSTKEIGEVIKKYDKVQDLHKVDLHHYFRFIYHILKFIKLSDISEVDKYQYSSILRATLSPYEIVMLFYNGLHPFGAGLKLLMEEFSFLKNIDRDLLIDAMHESEYHKLAMPDSSQDRPRLLEEWKKLHNLK